VRNLVRILKESDQSESLNTQRFLTVPVGRRPADLAQDSLNILARAQAQNACETEKSWKISYNSAWKPVEI
jgi:hypothetical protein